MHQQAYQYVDRHSLASHLLENHIQTIFETSGIVSAQIQLRAHAPARDEDLALQNQWAQS